MTVKTIKEFLAESNVKREDASAKVAKLVAKWNESGLLKDLKGYHKSNMAIMLENESKYIWNEYRQQVLQEASTMAGGDVEGFASVAFPLVRRIFGGLIANKIVAVQPISLPNGLIFFIDYVHNSSRLNETADTSIYGGGVVARQLAESGVYVDDTGTMRYGETGFQAMNNGYSSATGSITTLGITELAAPFEIGATTTTDAMMAYLDWDPNLVSGTWATVLQVSLSEANWQKIAGDNLVAIKAYNSGSTATVFSGSTQVRRLTKRIQESGVHKLNLVFHNTATFNTLTTSLSSLDLHFPRKDTWEAASGLGAIIGASPWELEFQQEIPEINVKVNAIDVRSVTKKLKAKWSPELSQDLQAHHAVDAESELTSVLSDYVEKEIDSELLAKLVAGAKAGTLYWSARPGKFVDVNTGADISSATNPPDYTGNLNDWYQGLAKTISFVSARIGRKTKTQGANFLVIGTEMAVHVEMIRGYQASVTHEDEGGDMGWNQAGSINKKWDVYVAPEFRRNVILVGRKGSGFLESGFVYSPYTPLQMSPTLLHPEDFTPRKALMTRYASKMVQPHYYGLVVVEDFDG